MVVAERALDRHPSQRPRVLREEGSRADALEDVNPLSVCVTWFGAPLLKR